MVDTVRSLSALQTLLADNTAGDISAQDLRDFLVSALLETDVQSVVGSDVTAAAGKHYELTVSGMTADRNFILPASAVIGSTISVKLMTDAPSTFELIIKGAALVTINGGTAATEWSRLFINNEVVVFRATSATNWDVVQDGRIPQSCYAYLSTSAIDAAVNFTWSDVVIDNVEYDTGGIFNATNDTFIVRRTSTYLASAFITISSTVAGGFLQLKVENDTTTTRLAKAANSHSKPDFADCAITAPIQVTQNHEIGFDIFNETGVNQRIEGSANRQTWISLTELI